MSISDFGIYRYRDTVDELYLISDFLLFNGPSAPLFTVIKISAVQIIVSVFAIHASACGEERDSVYLFFSLHCGKTVAHHRGLSRRLNVSRMLRVGMYILDGFFRLASHGHRFRAEILSLLRRRCARQSYSIYCYKFHGIFFSSHLIESSISRNDRARNVQLSRLT